MQPNEFDVGAGLVTKLPGKPITDHQNPPLPMNKCTDNLCTKPALTHHQRRQFPTIPRPLTEPERTLIALYSHCSFRMTPQQFYTKWAVTKDEIATICSRSLSTVDRWFTQRRSYRPPTSNDLLHLALMDFILEHFEEIPKALFDLLCPPK